MNRKYKIKTKYDTFTQKADDFFQNDEKQTKNVSRDRCRRQQQSVNTVLFGRSYDPFPL